MNRDGARSIAALGLAVLGIPAAGQARLAAQQPAPKAFTSYQLIGRALAAGRVSEETAHKYRVFAAFGDTRLPEVYRGDDGALDVTPTSVLDAQRLMKTFSAETQTELRPFFLRPASPGSWITLTTVRREQTSSPPGDDGSEEDSGIATSPTTPATSTEGRTGAGWYVKSAVGGKVQVWAQLRYADDSAKADAIAAALTSKIWPALVGLFWEPLDDANLDDNGGSGALDVYLVRPEFSEKRSSYNLAKYGRTSWGAIAMYADPAHQCGESPHYILLDSRRPLGGERSIGLLQDLAHELTHAITGRKPLLNYDCDEYAWIREATGKWAEHFVYPNAQSEHDMARYFLEDPREPLDSVTKSEDERHQYGAYLFPLHLMAHGRLRSMPLMWEQFGTRKSLAGIDAALAATGENLETTFPKFAVDNWNRATANTYDRIDELKTAAKVWPDSFNVSISGNAPYEKFISMGMYHLSTEYVSFQFDNTVKAVTFENTVKAFPFASVWGITKIKGQWKQPVDWTDSAGVTWCRDVSAEDVEELVIVFTNKQWKDKKLRVETSPSHRPVVRAYSVGCAAWTGTTTVTTTITVPDQGSTITEVVHSTARFEIDSSSTVPGEPRQSWKVVSGSLDWRVSVTGRCTGATQGSRQILLGGDDNPEATVTIWEDGGKLVAQVNEGPWPADVPTYTMRCPDQPPAMMLFMSAGIGIGPDLGKVELAPDGRSFSGHYSTDLQSSSGALKKEYHYSFQVTP